VRVNVYAEEMTDRVEVISKTTEDGEFTGLRICLELPCTVPRKVCERDGMSEDCVENVRGPFIHRPGDDDSAAVTFWGKKDLRDVLVKAIAALDAHHSSKSAVCAAQMSVDEALLQRAPYLDRPCGGGQHFTLGYTEADNSQVWVCPNKDCKQFNKETA